MTNIIKYLITSILGILLATLGPLTVSDSYAQNGNDDDNIVKLKQQANQYQESGEGLKLAQTLAKMGYLYAKAKNYKNSIEAYKRASSLYLQNKKLDDARKIYSNIGFVYTDDENYADALTNFEKALKTARLQGKDEAISACETDVAYILMVEKEYYKAIDKLLDALSIAQEIEHTQLTIKCIAMLMECYQRLGIKAKYIEYQNKLNNFSSHVQSEANKQEVTNLQIKNAADKERSDLEQRIHDLEMQAAARDKEDMKRAQEEERKRLQQERLAQQQQREQLEQDKAKLEEDRAKTVRLLKAEEERTKYLNTILWGGSLFLILLLIILFLLWRNARKRKKLNTLLQENNSIIEDQNKMLEDWSKELQVAYDEVSTQKQSISDSIYYAEHIQMSMLIPPALIQKELKQSFVFLKPRDVVSGDFYWFHKHGDKMYIAAIDCTGHGVPGAMISMVGYNILENIMSNTKFIHPNEIMDQMHLDIRRVLRQDTTDNQDGMDMALCMVNPKMRTVEYCGAKNSMVIIHSGEEPIKVPPDAFGVGGHVTITDDAPNGERRFTNHKFQADDNTTFYIYSDGFSDQFGGPKDKKYFLGNFRKLLGRLSEYPISEQQQLLEKELHDWQGSREQTDDILVIGFKA